MENVSRANPGDGSEDFSVSNTSVEQNNNEIITSEDELREIFFNYSSNFNVVHINAQSIPKHYLSLLATFVNLHNVDAVLVSETFLKESMDSKVGDMPGFNLIRNDRAGKGCGGVAIYLRKELQYKIVDKSLNYYTMSAEHLFIEVFHKETKILLGVFYSPSSTINYFSSAHVNILGDFNTNLMKKNRRQEKLLSIVDGYKLHLLTLGPTHFAPKSAASTLDLIIVSDIDKVAKHGQLGSGFSYHDLIYVSNILKPWRKRIPFNDTLKISPKTNEDQTRWQKHDVIEALAEQMKALKIYKQSDRGESDLNEYRSSRKSIEKLEEKFQRENRKIQKSKK